MPGEHAAPPRPAARCSSPGVRIWLARPGRRSAYVVSMRTFVDVRCPQVVGRAAELAAIDAVITGGGVVVVEGEPGVGKSRLAAAAAQRARAAGMAVVSGRATPGAATAFRPLAEVLMALS